MTLVDWIAIGVIALAALHGMRRGLVGGAFSLAGLAAGALLGARLAPQFLNDSSSAYVPVVALVGAIGVAVLLQGLASLAGGIVRNTLFVLPPLRILDTALGVVLGAAIGVALVWVIGAVALNLPGQTELRREVQASQILRKLNREFPPERLMDALARVDPFGSISGPDAAVGPPDPRLANLPGVRAAAPSVLRVTGTACGLGIEGSGWIAAPNLVVTNAHVVAGVRDAHVDRRNGDALPADVVSFDSRNDVAVLRVPGLTGRPLQIANPRTGVAVAILGYPENGPLSAIPARLGQTTQHVTDDAYGRGPVTRVVTTLRGSVRHGNSGGPAVDANGVVRTTIFAQRLGSSGGYGTPAKAVRQALANAGRTVPVGPCVR
jgi:S1-C subfamily serine protease